MSSRGALGFVAGLALALCLPFMLGQVSGFPSRPQFRAVGVGAPAAQGVGTITGNATDGVALASGTMSLLVHPDGVNFDGDAPILSVGRANQTFTVALHAPGVNPVNGADLGIGDSVFLAKDADTSRASDTAFTIDDNLQVSNLPAGLYAVEVFLSATEGGGGFKWRFAAPDDARAQGTRACSTLSNIRVTTTDANTCAAGAAVYFFYGGGATTEAVTGGTLGIAWGQDTSNAAATVLDTRSWLKLTRLK